MYLTIIPKSIEGLITQLGIDVERITACTAEELDVLLEPLPTLDKRLLYNINGYYNRSISKGMKAKYLEDKVGKPESMLLSFLSNINMVDLNSLNNHTDLINCVLENGYVKELRDNINKGSVIVIDDGFLKNLVNGDARKFFVTLITLQVYNEVVCTGRTPVNLTQQLFKYI